MAEIILVAGLLIILILAVIAAVLHWRLYKVERARAAAADRAEVKRSEQRERINNSIQVIARALEVEQVGATEASIRISVLMDALEVDQGTKSEFAAFYKLAEEASHIPVLDAWKALPRKERKGFEQELVALESKYRDFVLDASTRIQGRQF